MTWSVLQSAGANFFGTSVTATFGSNAGGGNKIIAVVGSDWSDAPTSVKDAAANAWTLLGSATSTTNGSIWLYGLDVPAGDVGIAVALTALFPSSNGQSIVVAEVSGLLAGNTSAMLDGTPATLTGTAAITGSPSYSSAASGEFLICGYADKGGAVTTTAASGMTRASGSQANFSDASIEYGNSTGGAESTGFGGAFTTGWTVLTVAFRLAAAPGGASAVSRLTGWWRAGRLRRARTGPRGTPGAGIASAVVTPLGTPMPPSPRPAIRHPVPRRALTGRGGPGAGIASAIVTPLGSPGPRWRAQPRHPGPARAAWHAGAVPAPAVQVPARLPPQARRPPPSRAVAGPRQVAGGIASPVVTPRGTPGPQWRPAPRRPGPARVTWHGQAGPQAVAPATPQAGQHLAPPVRRPAPARAVTGRSRCGGGQAGGPNAAPVTQGQPRPLAAPRGRPPQRALWHGNPSPVVTPLGTPARRPGPVITGRPLRRATWRGIAGTLPAVITAPPRCKPLAPRRRPQRAVSRRGAGLVNLAPPAFTDGVLTAATAATSTLTAGTAASGTLTATTSTTGGPS